MTNAVSNALAAKKEVELADPRMLVRQMSGDLSAALPTHIHSDAWLRRAAGALRKGRIDKDTGEFELVIAARNNPQAFANALREAAGLGLVPGTDEYYLTPRRIGGPRGQLEILGIVGYQGYIELMYRAGAVASVIVETVHTNDGFEYVPGRDEMPIHAIDWRSPNRGELDLVYAYGRMQNGAISKVVVLNHYDIEQIKKKAQNSAGEHSPWQLNPKSMWLKSAVRQLRKWVPTSAEYLNTQVRAAHEVAQGAVQVPDLPVGRMPVPTGHQVQINDPDEVVDGELMEESPPDDEEPSQEPVSTPMNKKQLGMLHALFAEKGKTTPELRHAFIKGQLHIEVDNSGGLTMDQASRVIDALTKLPDADKSAPAEAVTPDVPSTEPAG